MQEEVEFDEGPATLESYTDDEMWYFDLPTGAWERQEEKNRTLRSQVRQNMEGRRGVADLGEAMPTPMPRLHRLELPPMPNLAPGAAPAEERSSPFAWRGDPEIEALIEEKFAKRPGRAVREDPPASAAPDVWEFRPAPASPPTSGRDVTWEAAQPRDIPSGPGEYEWVAEAVAGPDAAAVDASQSQTLERKGLLSRFLRKPKAGEPAEAPEPGPMAPERTATRADNPFFRPAPTFAEGLPTPRSGRALAESLKPEQLASVTEEATRPPSDDTLAHAASPEAAGQHDQPSPPTEQPRALSRLHARRIPDSPSAALAAPGGDAPESVDAPAAAVYQELTGSADKVAPLGHARVALEDRPSTPAAEPPGSAQDDDPWAEFLQDRAQAGRDAFRFTATGRTRSE